MACPFCGGPIASEEQNECGDYETTAYTRIAELEAENERLTAWMNFAREQMSDYALREVDRRYIARNCKEMP